MLSTRLAPKGTERADGLKDLDAMLKKLKKKLGGYKFQIKGLKVSLHVGAGARSHARVVCSRAPGPQQMYVRTLYWRASSCATQSVGTVRPPLSRGRNWPPGGLVAFTAPEFRCTFVSRRSPARPVPVNRRARRVLNAGLPMPRQRFMRFHSTYSYRWLQPSPFWGRAGRAW